MMGLVANELASDVTGAEDPRNNLLLQRYQDYRSEDFMCGY